MSGFDFNTWANKMQKQAPVGQPTNNTSPTTGQSFDFNNWASQMQKQNPIEPPQEPAKTEVKPTEQGVSVQQGLGNLFNAGIKGIGDTASALTNPQTYQQIGKNIGNSFNQEGQTANKEGATSVITGLGAAALGTGKGVRDLGQGILSLPADIGNTYQGKDVYKPQIQLGVYDDKTQSYLDNHPVYGFAGEQVPFLFGGEALNLGKAAEGVKDVGLAQRVAKDAAIGAGLGALNESKEGLQGRVSGAAQGAVMGAAGGAVAHGVTEGAKILANALKGGETHEPTFTPQSVDNKPVIKGTGKPADINALKWGAEQLGVSPEELASVMALESDLNPKAVGGDKGLYHGLIQFGPGAMKETGFNPNVHNTFESQMPYVVKYFKGRGFDASKYTNPADRQTALYSTVLAGSPERKYWGSRDSNGTSAAGVAKRMLSGDLRQRAVKFLGNDGEKIAAQPEVQTEPTFTPQSTEETASSPLPFSDQSFEGQPDYSLYKGRYVGDNTEQAGGQNLEARQAFYPLIDEISAKYKVDPDVVRNLMMADKYNIGDADPMTVIETQARTLRGNLDSNGGDYEKAIGSMFSNKKHNYKDVQRTILGYTPEEYAQRAAQYESDPYIASGKMEDLFPGGEIPAEAYSGRNLYGQNEKIPTEKPNFYTNAEGQTLIAEPSKANHKAVDLTLTDVNGRLIGEPRTVTPDKAANLIEKFGFERQSKSNIVSNTERVAINSKLTDVFKDIKNRKPLDVDHISNLYRELVEKDMAEELHGQLDGLSQREKNFFGKQIGC